MSVRLFIARRLSYRSPVVTAAIAVSFLVVIIAIAVSGGFRNEIRDGLSEMSGDVLLSASDINYLDESSSVHTHQSYMTGIKNMDGVASVRPVIYRAGIVKHSENIYGVMVKGVEAGASDAGGTYVPDSTSLAVSIPSSLAEISGLKTGDRMLTYFVGDKVKVRQFNVVDVYEPLVRTDDRYLVYADIEDIRRLNGWTEEQTSMFEVLLEDDYREGDALLRATEEISDHIYYNASPDDDMLMAASSADRFPQVFEWLTLIDFNVMFVLVLMIAVAGVNMITGLLIMLFENISTIGLFKSLGMRNAEIVNVFLTRASITVLKGMLVGNVLALAFCLLQESTHLIQLDPANYFVSYVPVHIDFTHVLCADALAFVVIMLLMLLPSLFVLRVDPARTVKMD